MKKPTLINFFCHIILNLVILFSQYKVPNLHESSVGSMLGIFIEILSNMLHTKHNNQIFLGASVLE